MGIEAPGRVKALEMAFEKISPPFPFTATSVVSFF